MKKQVSLSISSPCSEKWSSFQPTSDGGFCEVCQKNVIDFTQMTEKEIADYFLQQSGKACGKFRPEQLKTYQEVPVPRFRQSWNWLKTGLLGVSLLFFTKESQAQSPASIAYVQNEKQVLDEEEKKTAQPSVSGVVTDEEGEPLPGVNVWLKGTDKGIITNLDGEFRFPHALSPGDVLVFMYIGFRNKEYLVPEKLSTQSISIEMEMDYCELMGEVAVHEVYEEPSRWGKFRGKLSSIFK